MIEFRPPVLEDKSRIDKILENADFKGSFYSFAAIYTWAERYHTEVAFYNDALLILGWTEQVGLYFLYPVGSFETEEILEIMREEAKRRQEPLKIVAETYKAKELYNAFPGRFVISDSRDDWDYVYNCEDLAFLRGNRYHGKRNHISRMSKKHADAQFVFEPINVENTDDCMQIEEAWTRDKDDDSDFENVRRSLIHMNELGLSGGLLRLNDKAIAFTVGEPLTRDTFVIHIEKSMPGYDGAYQMINQLFAKTLVGKYQFINREEDMGIEGLRSSKLSYFPCCMIEKCVITERK